MSFNSLDPDEQPNNVPKEVMVSVRIVTYNHGPYIKQAIDSVLMQRTNFPFEILIGEDDSTDGTREICKEYAARYPDRIRLFLRQDKDKIYVDGRKTGKSNARRTRAACRGKYIAMLEGDDFWIDAEKLQRQFDFLEANPDVEFCGARCLHWDPSGMQAPFVDPLPEKGNFLRRWEILRSLAYVHTSTFFTRAEVYRDIGSWTREIIQGDLAFLIELSRRQGGVYVLPHLVSIYRVSGSGIWTSESKVKQTEMRQKFWENFLPQAKSVGDIEGVAAASEYLNYLKFRKTVYVRWPKFVARLLVAVRFPRLALRQFR